MEYVLKCTKCSKTYPSSYKSQTCDLCGGILEVIYDYKINRKVFENAQSFWDFEPLMPKGIYKHFELGMTKLIPSKERNLFFKLEFENPTKSFKDRGSIIEVAKAKEYGYDSIACASTGNMAYSISYYAKLYGINSSVFISKGANKDKLINIKDTHDAELHLINGDFTKAQRDAELYAKKNNAFLGGDYCYRKEGQATIAYEMFMQRPSLSNIIVPVGNATLFSALYKAYAMLKKAHIVKTVPRLIGVEAENCSPIYNAIKSNSSIKYTKPRTLADAIAVGMPTYGDQAIEAVNNTEGLFVTVSDKEMAASQEQFYMEYGIKIELAAAAGIAASKKLSRTIKNEETAIILTGANI
ncbi:MAG: threonine synthase [Candidatus Micrarchaeia archaeon]